MCGFIAQLLEQRTGNAEVTGLNPVEALIFFFEIFYRIVRFSGRCYWGLKIEMLNMPSKMASSSLKTFFCSLFRHLQGLYKGLLGIWSDGSKMWLVWMYFVWNGIFSNHLMHTKEICLFRLQEFFRPCLQRCKAWELGAFDWHSVLHITTKGAWKVTPGVVTSDVRIYAVVGPRS